MSEFDTTFKSFGKPFQEKVLQALLSDHAWSQQMMEVLKTEYFEINHLRYLFEIYSKYYATYKTFPSITLLATMARDDLHEGKDDVMCSQVVAFLQSIKSNPNMNDIPYVKDRSLNFCKNQALKCALEEAVDLTKDERYDEIVGRIRKAITVGTPNTTGHDFFEDVEARFIKENRNVIRTGMSQLDARDVMNGGLGGGELGCVMAATGVGKSHFLVQLGASALRDKKNVLHYTFELNERKVGIRYDSNLTNVSATDIPDEKEFVIDHYRNNEYGRLIIKEYPTSTATVLTLKSHIEKLAITKSFKPDIVIVDYADIMRSTRSFDSLRHELKLVYEELRGLAMEVGTPIWTACFHGDTLISSPTGKFKIKDRVGQEGFPVYSYDHEKQRLVLKKVKSVYKSGENKELWKVKLDNDREIIVTPNHKFMMRDGTYKELRDVKVGDSLMPFNRRMKDGRKQIYLNNGKWEWLYRVVGEWKYGEIPKYHQIHHIDMNKFNDHPDNLEMLTISEHYHKHGKASWYPGNPCGLDRLRKSYSERMKTNNPSFNPATRKKASESRKGKCMGLDNPMMLLENRQKCSKAIKESVKFNEYKRRVPGIMQSVWASRSVAEKANISRKIQVSRFGSTRDCRVNACEQLVAECSTLEEFIAKTANIKLRDSKKEKIWYAVHTRVRKKMSAEQRESFKQKLQMSKYGSTTDERIQRHVEIAIQCKTREEFFEKCKSIPLDIKHKSAVWNNKNHKVVSIEFYGFDDVYNMEVEDLHNYALDAGVVVKNSQVNREGNDSDVVGLDKISEAFGKAMICDFIVSLARKPLQKSKGLCNLFVAKSRLGKDGILFPTKIDTSRSTFEVLDNTIDLEEFEKSADNDMKQLLKDKWSEVANERLITLRKTADGTRE